MINFANGIWLKDVGKDVGSLRSDGRCEIKFVILQAKYDKRR
jgi:hypothetical protein